LASGCSLVLAVDVGTTSVKAGVVECSTLDVVSRASRPTPLTLRPGGVAEQDPGELWEAISGASREALEPVRGRVDAVVFSTYLAGTVLIGEEGPLTPLITWLDERGAGLPEELFRGPLRVAGYSLPRLLEMLWIAGGAPGRSGKDPLSKVRWLQRELGDAFREARVVGGLKTWIAWRAAGRPVTTPDEAHLTWLADTRGGRARWSERLAKRYGVPLRMLPEIVEPSSVVGRLRSDAAGDLGLEGRPLLVAGAGDVASAALGSGAVGEGEYHLYIGTSGWAAVHSSRRLVDVRHYAGSILSALPGRYLVIAENETAGALVDWVLGVTGRGYDALEEAAREIPPGSEGVLIAPWLQGERCPIDDPHARGVIVGLSLSHGPLHLVRAAMESVALTLAWDLEIVSRMAGPPRALRGVGGGFLSRGWARIVASSVGARIEVPRDPHLAGVRGAAAIAVSALTGAKLEEVARRTRVWYTVEPDEREARIYRAMLRALKKLHPSLKDVFKDLAAAGGEEKLRARAPRRGL
jgi:xylulokinase